MNIIKFNAFIMAWLLQTYVHSIGLLFLSPTEIYYIDYRALAYLAELECGYFYESKACINRQQANYLQWFYATIAEQMLY